VQPIFVVSIPCIAIKYRLGQLQKQELGGLFLKVKEKLPFCLFRKVFFRFLKSF
ncbi:MAG: hypothetical protein ACI8VJ_001164, partial [Polaribacter sp.]